MKKNSPSALLLTIGMIIVALCIPISVGAVNNPLYEQIVGETGSFSCLSAKEAQLFQLINEYRESHGLPPVANSRSLNKVARSHALDLHENRPYEGHDSRGAACNLHSWSDAGSWTPVCYTPDHRYAEKMWNKPREITNYQYPGDGYENAYWTSEDEVSVARVLEGWKKSPAHNALILEEGIWKGSNMLSFGIGIYKNVAVMWVGSLVDPVGPMQSCE
jgi:hypothetical protein